MADFATAGLSPRQRALQVLVRQRVRLRLGVWIFIGSLIWPASLAFQIGTLNMQIYKFALVALVPLIAIEMVRNPIRLRAPDYLLLLFGFLQGAITIYHHGFIQDFLGSVGLGVTWMATGIENSGITFLETLVPYFCARVLIRTSKEVAVLLRVLVLLVVALGATTLYESITGFSLYHMGQLPFLDLRQGFYRAYGPFPHPILWGLFAASAISFTLVTKDGQSLRLPNLMLLTLTLVATYTSLSSGAALAMVVQFALFLWLAVSSQIRNRWRVFSMLFIALYLAIDIASNRTPVHVLIDYATFNSGTGFYRMLIWHFGWENFLTSPFVGIGYNDWFRAHWMHGSIDAFWLVLLMRYGLLGAVPFILAIVHIVYSAGIRESEQVRPFGPLTLSTALMFSLVGYIVAGFTVHFWAHSYVFFMFLVGVLALFGTRTANVKTASIKAFSDARG